MDFKIIAKKFFLCYRVTINKTVEMDNNTDTLKKLSSSEKPNNQTKLANTGGTAFPLLPGQIKCNILKGWSIAYFISWTFFYNPCRLFRTARAEEELGATSTIKMTNHSNATSPSDGPDSLNAATYVSVVSSRPIHRSFSFLNLFVDANFIICFSFVLHLFYFVCAYKCMHFQHQILLGWRQVNVKLNGRFAV